MQINFVGDVCLEAIDIERFALDPRLVELAASADHNVANLESPLTEAEDGMPYRVRLIKASPRPNRIIELFDVFSLANNHMMDYKQKGLADTIDFLRRHEKRFFGAGLDREEALRPVKLDRDEVRVALLGCTRWRKATRTSAGTAPDHVRALKQRVRQLSRAGYFVVVMPHWNYEYVDYPAPSNRQLARKLIDAGADLIVGSHPHIVQGYERYAGKWVFHSLGNFVFDPGLLSRAEKGDPRIRQSFVLRIDVQPDNSYMHKIIPVHTDAGGVRLMDEPERAAMLQRLAEISSAFHDQRTANRRFYEQAGKEAGRISAQMNSMVRKKGLMYILSRLHRVQIEDFKIKLHGVLGR